MPACPAGQGTLVPASIPDPAPPCLALEGGRKFRSWGGRRPGADTKNQRWGRGHLEVSGSRVGLGSKLGVSRLAPQGSFWWSLRRWELYPRPPGELDPSGSPRVPARGEWVGGEVCGVDPGGPGCLRGGSPAAPQAASPRPLPPSPQALGARAKPAAVQGGRPRVRRGPDLLSFSLKFHTPCAFGRSPECASSEQFVFHGAFASITPLFPFPFQDHWGCRGLRAHSGSRGHAGARAPPVCTPPQPAAPPRPRVAPRAHRSPSSSQASGGSRGDTGWEARGRNTGAQALHERRGAVVRKWDSLRVQG